MVAGYVEGLEGQTIRGWVMSNEGTCRISVADAEGNPLATGMADRYGQSPDPPPYRYGFRFRISLPAASPSLRVFADGQELAGSPVALGPDLFDGQISMVDGKIVGWVQERTVDATPRPVDIHDQYGRPVARVNPLTDGQEGPFRFAADAPASLHGLSEIGLVAICNGVVFAKTTCCLPVKGYLEHVGSERVGGWALIPGLPNRKLRLQFCLDGEPVVEATCDMLRGDLEPVYPSADQNVLRCGFDVSLPPPPRGTAPILSVRLAESQVELFNGPRGIGDVPWVVHSLRKANQMLSDSANLTAAEQDFLRQAFAKLTAQTRTSNARTLFTARAFAGTKPGREPRVSIIIPVYRDVSVTRECIESVLAHRCATTDTVIVINDKSPDPAMGAMLEAAFGRTANFWLLSNPTNRGFIGSVNRGLIMARRGDVILLNSDTEFFPGGLDELVQCAALSKTVGTVTPLSNNATIFTYPHPTQPAAVLDDMAWSEVAALALQQPRRLITVPTGHGFCLYIKREVLDQVGLLDEVFGRGYGEENDFCQRAADLGYRNVAAPTVFVRHRESVSFGDEKDALRAHNIDLLCKRYPEWQFNIDQWERDDALRVARWPFDRERLRAAYQRGMRFMVSIENDLTGGTKQAIRDIEEHVGFNGREIARCCAESDAVVVRVRALGVVSSYHIDEVDELFETMSCMQPSLCIVHQLLGFGDAFVRRLTATTMMRTLFIAHDFYPVCPRTTMIDAVDRFCGGPSQRCDGCLKLGGAHPRSRLDLAPVQHRALLGGFLRACSRVTAPSRDTANRLAGCFPGLEVADIPHPEIRPPAALTRRRRDPNAVVLLGAIGPHKGSAALLNLVQIATMDAPNLHFHIVGYTDLDDTFEKLHNVTLHGKYDQAQLTAIFHRINAGKAVFLYQWPETYSYTLSEVVRNGIVPVLPDLGAPAERSRKLGFGKIIGFPMRPAAILCAIAEPNIDFVAAEAAAAQIAEESRSSVKRLRLLLDEEQAIGSDKCLNSPEVMVRLPPRRSYGRRNGKSPAGA